MDAQNAKGDKEEVVEGQAGDQAEAGGGDERVIHLQDNFLQKYIMGDIQVLNDWLSDKPAIVQFPNWLLRAIGAPIFLNNPISGVLILVGMFISNPWVAVNALLGLVIAIVTAVGLAVDRGDIASGGATFHGMLVGIVLSSSIDKPDWYPWTIFPVMVMAAISVFLASGLGAIFGKFNLPAFNFPFIVSAFVFIAAAGYSTNNPHFPIKAAAAPGPAFNPDDVHWGKLFSPLLLAGAQIYGSTSFITGALVFAAQLVCSPTIAIHALLSAILSIFTAVAMAAPLEEIYDGVWSYNAMLTCTALGGFFYVITLRSHVVALFSAVFATVTHGAVGTLLRPAGLPVIAFPFVIAASIFLSVTSTSSSLKRVPMDSISYPEKHRRLYKANLVGADPDGSSSA